VLAFRGALPPNTDLAAVYQETSSPGVIPAERSEGRSLTAIASGFAAMVFMDSALGAARHPEMTPA
jgi:hypothetical protein